MCRRPGQCREALVLAPENMQFRESRSTPATRPGDYGTFRVAFERDPKVPASRP